MCDFGRGVDFNMLCLTYTIFIHYWNLSQVKMWQSPHDQIMSLGQGIGKVTIVTVSREVVYNCAFLIHKL